MECTEYLLYMRKPDIIEFATRTFGLGMFKQGINKNGKKLYGLHHHYMLLL